MEMQNIEYKDNQRDFCRNLLEINKLNEYVFDNNFRLKQVIKEKGNY